VRCYLTFLTAAQRELETSLSSSSSSYSKQFCTLLQSNLGGAVHSYTQHRGDWYDGGYDETIDPATGVARGTATCREACSSRGLSCSGEM
jgi:hypothetical protein